MSSYDYDHDKYATYEEATQRATFSEEYYRREIFGALFSWRGLSRLIWLILFVIATFGISVVVQFVQWRWDKYDRNNKEGVLNPSAPPRSRLNLSGFVIEWTIRLIIIIVFLIVGEIVVSLFLQGTSTKNVSGGALVLRAIPRWIGVVWLAHDLTVTGVSESRTRMDISFLQGIALIVIFGVIYTAISGGQRLPPQESLANLMLFYGSIVAQGLLIALFWQENTVGNDASLAEPLPLNPQTYRMYFRRDNIYSSQFNEIFLQYLSLIFGEFALRIVGNHRQIVWELVDIRGLVAPETAINAIQVKLPDVKIVHRVLDLPDDQRPALNEVNLDGGEGLVPSKDELQAHTTLYSFGQFLRYFVPLRRANELIPDENPIAEMVSVMSKLPQDNLITATLIVAGKSSYAQDWGIQYLTAPVGWFYPILSFFGRGTRSQHPAISPKQFQIYTEKLSRELYHCLFFVAHTSMGRPNNRDYTQLLQTVLEQVSLRAPNELIVLEDPASNLPEQCIEDSADYYRFARQAPFDYYQHWASDPASWREWRHAEMILETDEIVNLWRLPDQSFGAPSIEWLDETPPISAALKTNSANENGVAFGVGRYNSEDVYVYVPDETRQRHLSILGQTGMGKSTFMHNLIHQDILKNDGRTIIFMDPHGDGVRDVLRWSIPEDRIDDVVVLQLKNSANPIPFNLFDMKSDDATIAQIADVIDAMDRGLTGHQTKRYLYMGLRAVAYMEQATMLDFRALLENETYGRKIITVCKHHDDHIAAQFWEAYWAKTNKGSRTTQAAPILNRIAPFYLNEYLTTILCHPDGLNLEQLLQGNKIILLSLDNSGIPVSKAQQDLIGAIFISLLKSVVMQQDRGERPPIYCYVDEQQRFSTPAFAEIFSEARKRGLYMAVGNQFTHQLDEMTIAAIRGNVTTHVVFNVGADDASRFQSVIGEPFTAHDLTNLNKHNMVIKTQLDGYSQAPFLAQALPPPDEVWHMPDNDAKDATIEAADQWVQEIITASVHNYTPREQADIREYINRRYFHEDADVPLGNIDTFDS